MPVLTGLPDTACSRLVTDCFSGYDRRARPPEGSFRDTRNLSLRDYPLLSTRPKRGLLRTLSAPGGMIAKDALCYVDGGTLYVNHLPSPLSGISPGEKQLVSMGAYVCVFPDKLYYNTEDPSDYGSMEAELSLTGEIRCCLCDRDGTPRPDPDRSPSEPEDPANGQLWLDGGKLMQYSRVQRLWVELPEVYTRVTLPSQGRLPALFSPLDGVSLEGAPYPELDGEKLLLALGGGEGEDDWFVVTGLIPAAAAVTGSLRLRRSVPDLDFVCEAGNRLWGCYYGSDGTRNLNEIYACALGDFKNWRQYQGLSTDSWTAGVGSDGPWTGAVGYLGSPCFFKEDRIHRVEISASGAHRLEEIPCRGVQRGSHKSLCLVGDTLYYKSPGEVCAWQGGFPLGVSGALGEQRFSRAAAGSLDGRYYLSMQGEDGTWRLFVYDSVRELWIREDELHALCFARAGDELWALDADSGALIALLGSAGTPETELDWSAETGILRYAGPDRQYLSRFDLSLRLEAGASLEVYLRYDSAGDWLLSGRIDSPGERSVSLPVRPRRCDHLQLRLQGRGAVRIDRLTRVLEVGSDV